MAEDVLHEKKPGADFVRKLREELNGRIVELPDGGVQVFYDFVGEQELADWRTYEPYDAAPTIRDDKLDLTQRLILCNYAMGTGAVF